jgi:hypothetical protein
VHDLGQVFLLIVAVTVCGGVLLGQIARIREAGPGSSQRGRSAFSSPGTRPGGRGSRPGAARSAGTAGRSAAAAVRHPGNSQIRTQARADLRRAWGEAKATDWLEQRRHDRQNGTSTTPDTSGTAAKTAEPMRKRLGRLVPFRPSPDGSDPGNGGSTGTSGPGPEYTTGGVTDEEARRRTRKHLEDERRRNGGSQPSSTNGGTGPVAAGTSTASAEKLIEGINEIHAHAAAGGIHAKQEAIKAAHEGSVRFAAMVQMLSRQMSEPGQNYGPEITEPLAQAGQHHQAAAMSLSESDAALSTLINMSVGDLAQSPRQAPHHTELSESGSR